MLCPKDIFWETEESTLSDFEYKYGNNLPQLFMVCDGFDGNELLHSFGSEDVFVVCSVATQSRVVVHDSSSRLLSIPMDTQLPVRTLSGNKASKARSLKAVMAEIASQNFSSNSIMFANNPQVAIQRGASEVIHSQCGVMDIVDLHSQKYLVGYSVVDGKIDPTPVLIPSYVPIHVIVAGMEGGAEEVSRWLSDITPPGTGYNVEDHFNTDVMVVSFSDIEGDGYEYVNPASKHQTLSRITAKVNGLRSKQVAPLSLPREWMDSSVELTEALNSANSPGSSSEDNSEMDRAQRGTLERAKHAGRSAAAKAELKFLRKSTDDIHMTSSTDARFLGDMRSISMIDLTQTNGATLSLPKHECPAKKYMRKSEHFGKSDSQSSRSSSEESINFALKGRNKKNEKSVPKPSVPPKPGKGKKPTKDKQQQKELLEEIMSKKSIKDKRMSHGSFEAEYVSSNLFAKISRVSTLRNAKSMTDLSTMSSSPNSKDQDSINVIDFKPKLKKSAQKKSQTVSAVTVGQKKKKRPFLLRLFSGSSWSTDQEKPPTPTDDKTKKKKGGKEAKATNAGKYKRHKSTSDIEMAADIAAMRTESEGSEGGGSVYADIPDHNTVDLLSDIRKATVERAKPAPGKFRTSYEASRAPALPPRNNENSTKQPLSPTMSTENPYELLPDKYRGDSLMRKDAQAPVHTPKLSSAPEEKRTKSPSPSDSSSFTYEFDPGTVLYRNNPTGHVTEFDSGGETSDETDSGGSATSDLESGSTDDAKSLKAAEQTKPGGDTARVNRGIFRKKDNKKDNNEYRPPLPKPRPSLGGAELPTIASRIQALTNGTDNVQLPQAAAPGRINRISRSSLDHPPPPPTSRLPDPPPVPSNRTSVASSVSEVGEAGKANLRHQESGYWSQSDNSYSDGLPFTLVLPKPQQTFVPSLGNAAVDPSAKYRTWADIPNDISDMTVEDVVDSLQLLKMTRYADAFREFDVDGDLLSELDEGVLQQDFGFTSFDAKKLVKFVKGWRPKLK